MQSSGIYIFIGAYRQFLRFRDKCFYRRLDVYKNSKKEVKSQPKNTLAVKSCGQDLKTARGCDEKDAKSKGGSQECC